MPCPPHMPRPLSTRLSFLKPIDDRNKKLPKMPIPTGNIEVVLLSMQSQKAVGFHKKILNLCSEDE